ncbi:MAG TPA: hypothetical protein DCS93_26800 [Microscillaceae bacterium]|nr:hypothetical protein [Microscillaceae bacterium]
MGDKKFQKIIPLLESEDEKNVSVGLELVTGLKLEKYVFEYFSVNQVLPDFGRELFRVNIHNDRMTFYANSGAPAWSEILRQIEKLLIKTPLEGKPIVRLMNALFYLLEGSVWDVQPVFYENGLFIRVKSTFIKVIAILKMLKELHELKENERQQITRDMYFKSYQPIYRWLEISTFCKLPINYNLDIIEKNDVILMLGFNME